MKNNKADHKSNVIGKKNILATTGVMVQLIALFARIPLTRVIGDEGNGIYSAAFEIYAIALLLTVSSMPEAMARTIAVRTARGQYRNAYRIFKTALFWNLIVGIVICLAFVLGGDYFADTVILVPMSAISLKMLGPAAIIMGLVVSFRGYFEGMGTTMPTCVSQIADCVVGAIASIIASLLLCNYGIKVAHLLHNNSFAAAFAVMGISVGTIIGLAVSFLFLLFVFGMFRQQRRKQMEKDNTRGNESTKVILHSLLYALIPMSLIACVYHASNIVDQIIYNHSMTESGQAAGQVVNYGIYSGKYKVMVWIPIAIASMIWIPIVPALNASYERVDMRLIRNKVSVVYRLTMIITIPFMIGLIIMARPVLNTFFRGDISLAHQLLKEGAPVIALISYASVGNAVLQGMNKIKIVTINNIIALALHIITLIVMLNYMNLGIHAVVYANIIMAFVTCGLNHLAIKKIMKYKVEWLRTFVIPLVASGVVGLIEYLIYKILEGAIGNTAAVILAFILGTVAYIILIVLFRTVNEKEMLSMPFGKMIVKIARITRVLHE